MTVTVTVDEPETDRDVSGDTSNEVVSLADKLGTAVELDAGQFVTSGPQEVTVLIEVTSVVTEISDAVG